MPCTSGIALQAPAVLTHLAVMQWIKQPVNYLLQPAATGTPPAASPTAIAMPSQKSCTIRSAPHVLEMLTIYQMMFVSANPHTTIGMPLPTLACRSHAPPRNTITLLPALNAWQAQILQLMEKAVHVPTIQQLGSPITYVYVLRKICITIMSVTIVLLTRLQQIVSRLSPVPMMPLMLHVLH